MTLLKSAVLACVIALTSIAASAAPVNVNKANAATLADALYGVGMRTAEAIVSYRDEHGPFHSADDLMNVKGIGPKLLERNRTDILLDQPERNVKK